MDAKDIRDALKLDRSMTFRYGRWRRIRKGRRRRQYKSGTLDTTLYFLKFLRSKGCYTILLRSWSGGESHKGKLLKGKSHYATVFSRKSCKAREAEIAMFHYVKDRFGIETLYLPW